MSLIRLAEKAPLTNREAVAEVRGATYWAAPDALYGINQGAVARVSEPFITQRGWEALEPETMRFFEHEGRLYVVAKGELRTDGEDYVGSAPGPTHIVSDETVLMFDPSRPDDGIRLYDMHDPIEFVLYKEDTAETLLVQGKTWGDREFEPWSFMKSSNLLDVWYTTKKYKFPQPVAFNCIRVRTGVSNQVCDISICCETGAENDWKWSFSKMVDNDAWFWLPNAPLGHRWYVQVWGKTQIRSIELATTPQEFDA
jgi:hypothetical protein